MATERQIDKMFWDLRRKYFAKSDTQIVAWDILDDINKYKKYEILNSYEMVDLFRRAVIATDGDSTFEYIYTENNGDLIPMFCSF